MQRRPGIDRDDLGDWQPLLARQLAIAQHLTVGLPASSAFPRLFQFGMRAGMRVWSTGQDWWQGDEGPYWGHNALVRIGPFRAFLKRGGGAS